MAFSQSWSESTPTGATNAALIDDRIREFKTAIRERLESLSGIAVGDYNTDPFNPTKYGPNITITTKNVRPTTVHDYGTWLAGASSIDWRNGNRQKITLGANGWAPTFVSGSEGADFTLDIRWAAPGYSFTLPSNVKWTNNTTPNFSLLDKTLVHFYYDGTNWRAGLHSTGVP